MPEHWLERPFAAYDCESTGVDTATDRIVTASMIRINGGGQPVTESYVIAVDVDIPAEATAVHHITTEHAREHGKPAAEVLDVVAADLAIAMNRGYPVIGFNCAFDFSILEHELRRNDLPTLHARLDGRIRPIVDAFVLDKHDAPYRKGGRKLTDVCGHRGVLLGGAHEASADALAAARLASVIVRGNEAMAALSLDELHDAQVTWRREQCESLAAHFARQGKPKHVCPHWPVCTDTACREEKAVA